MRTRAREVEAQYEEYRRTGKVRATLGEDDKVVRELYAAEVLKTPLSSLDAKWPREIGAKAAKARRAQGRTQSRAKPRASKPNDRSSRRNRASRRKSAAAPEPHEAGETTAPRPREFRRRAVAEEGEDAAALHAR